MTLPQSSTAMYFLISILPVCGSTSTTQTWVPNGKVKLDGSNWESAIRLGSILLGRFSAMLGFPRDLLNREPLLRHTLDAKSPFGEVQIVRIHL